MVNSTDCIAPEITPESFETAYRAGFRTTVRFLRSKGVSVEEAEDVAQSAWTQGWEARAQLLNPGAIVPWVNTIAYHQLCSMYRRSEKHVPLTGLEDAAVATPAAKADARTLLSQCTPRDRALLILRYFEGMDIREIAAIQGLSEVAVRVRIHRCQIGLRNKINRFVGRLWPAEPETQGAYVSLKGAERVAAKEMVPWSQHRAAVGRHDRIRGSLGSGETLRTVHTPAGDRLSEQTVSE